MNELYLLKVRQPMSRKKLVSYNFDSPIRIVRYRAGGLDIMFYAALLGISITLILFLLCFHDGRFVLKLTTARTLLSIPLILFAMLMASMLKEILIYTKILLRKSVWNIEELMKITKKDRRETERIITRVLEVGFVVDTQCIKNTDETSAV